jgi:hypothetical protein
MADVTPHRLRGDLLKFFPHANPGVNRLLPPDSLFPFDVMMLAPYYKRTCERAEWLKTVTIIIKHGGASHVDAVALEKSLSDSGLLSGTGFEEFLTPEHSQQLAQTGRSLKANTSAESQPTSLGR